MGGIAHRRVVHIVAIAAHILLHIALLCLRPAYFRTEAACVGRLTRGLSRCLAPTPHGRNCAAVGACEGPFDGPRRQALVAGCQRAISVIRTLPTANFWGSLSTRSTFTPFSNAAICSS